MKRLSVLVDIAIWLALLAGTSWFLCDLGQKTFDFFDMSAFMDAGYRVYMGQSPYVDFFYNAGPVHLYLHALFFTLFGFTKTAVLAHLCTVNAVVVTAAYVLGRRDLSRPVAAGLTLLVCLSHYGLIAHPWYDQNAGAFLVLALLLFELTFPRATGWWRLPAGFLCGALVVLSFFTKSNVGAAGMVIFFIGFVLTSYSSRDWVPLLSYVLGMLATVLVVMGTLESPQDFYFQTFVAYRPTNRLKNWKWLVGTWINHQCIIPTLLLVAVAGLGGRAFLRRNLLQIHFAAGFLLISVFTAWTGSMMNNSALLGMVLLYLFILAARLPAAAPRTPEWRIAWTLRGLNWLAALVLCFIWYDQRGSAWHWRASNLDAQYTLQAPGFEGWKCNEAIVKGLDEAVVYINEHVPQQETLFVFPDATIVYGLTGRPSYRKAPFIFHDGEVPPPGKPYDDFRDRFLSHPPQWILLHHDPGAWCCHTRYLLEWLKLDGYLATCYVTHKEFGNFTLYRLRSNAPLTVLPKP
jgi:hypothetical protein